MDKETFERWWASRYKHGGFVGGKEQPEHYIWRSMRDRCCNPNHKAYKHYGGRGITVCDRWASYENFLEDMGPRPSEDYSIDRVDNDKGYSPDNCRWALKSEQQKNKRTTRRYTNGTFTGTLVECAAYLGMSKELAHYHWKHNKTFEKGVAWQELPNARSKTR
jgi:hypothetical protein